MYRRLRNLIVIGSLLILAAGVFRYRLEHGPLITREEQTATAIEDTTIIGRGDILVTVSASGTISPAERLPMFFPVPGTVAEVLVEEGDAVQAGQTLARLETQDLELALQDAELALELQQIALDALTSEPREEEVAAAQAAVYAASAQLALAQEPPDSRNERIARLQLELARNQLWQAQLQRDQANVAAQFGIPLGEQASQAEATVHRAEYEVSIAEQQLEQAQNATANAANVAAASAALVNAQASLDRLLEGADERDVEIANARLQTAYLAVELARYQLEQAALEAPFSGIVAAVNLVVGEAPPTTAPAIELIDASTYYIDLAVDEIDIAQVEVGQPVQIALDALPDETVTGVVTRIGSVGTDLGGVVTYTVRITLDETEVPVRVGMTATATIIVDEARDVIRVPNRYVRLDRRTQQAFVTVRQPDDTLEEVEIQLGRRNETFSEVLGGLSEGEEVVLLPRSAFNPFSFAP